MVIVGAGPAGIAPLVKAARLGLLPGMLEEGVALISATGIAEFGIGSLGCYQINSNTHADAFVNSVITDKPDAIPSEACTGSCLELLRDSKVGKELLGYGPDVAPLSLIGRWLGEVAHAVRLAMEKAPKSKVHLNARALDITLINGNPNVHRVTMQYERPVIIEGTVVAKGSITTLHARSVVLATGGSQKIPSDLFNKSSLQKVIPSDFALTTPGMEKMSITISESPSRKIVIIGGSHSAFSVAWILLNVLTKNKKHNFDTGQILILHRSPVSVFYNTRRDAEADKYAIPPGSANKFGQINVFGGLRGDAKALHRRVQNGDESRIKMYRVPDTKGGRAVVEQAAGEASMVIWCAGYKTNEVPIFEETAAKTNPSGAPPPALNPSPPSEKAPKRCNSPFLKRAELSSPPESKGLTRTPVKLKLDGNQVDVDHTSAVLRHSTSLPVPALFGIGLGWGLRALNPNGFKDGSSGRMDGYGIYLKRAASCVLAGIMPGDIHKVFGDGNRRWDDRMVSVAKRLEEKEEKRRAEAKALVVKLATDDFNEEKRGSPQARRPSSRQPLSQSHSRSCESLPSQVEPFPPPVLSGGVSEEAQRKSIDRLSQPKPKLIAPPVTQSENVARDKTKKSVTMAAQQASINRLSQAVAKKKEVDNTASLQESKPTTTNVKAKNIKTKSVKTKTVQTKSVKSNVAAKSVVSTVDISSGCLDEPPMLTATSSTSSSSPSSASSASSSCSLSSTTSEAEAEPEKLAEKIADTVVVDAETDVDADFAIVSSLQPCSDASSCDSDPVDTQNASAGSERSSRPNTANLSSTPIKNNRTSKRAPPRAVLLPKKVWVEEQGKGEGGQGGGGQKQQQQQKQQKQQQQQQQQQQVNNLLPPVFSPVKRSSSSSSVRSSSTLKTYNPSYYASEPSQNTGLVVSCPVSPLIRDMSMLQTAPGKLEGLTSINLHKGNMLITGGFTAPQVRKQKVSLNPTKITMESNLNPDTSPSQNPHRHRNSFASPTQSEVYARLKKRQTGKVSTGKGSAGKSSTGRRGYSASFMPGAFKTQSQAPFPMPSRSDGPGRGFGDVHCFKDHVRRTEVMRSNVSRLKRSPGDFNGGFSYARNAGFGTRKGK